MWRKASLKLASLAALCAAVIATIGLQAANASSGRTALRGTAATSKARAHRVGSVSKSARENFDLVLKLRNRRGAVALLKTVSTPGSASYRHFLTTSQWEARFSPTKAQVAQARRWLRSQGFKVGKVSSDRMTIAASGTAAQVERAFSTGLARYRVKGHTVQLARRDLSVPASLAGTVLGTLGINQYVERPSSVSSPGLPESVSTTGLSSGSGYPPPPPAFIPIGPCSRYYGAKQTTLKPPFGQGYPTTVPDVVCGYKPPQLRSAYGVKSANMGKGWKVAIVDAFDSKTIVSDSTRYFKQNDPSNPFSRAHLVRTDAMPFTNQAVCASSSWLVEQAIDIQSIHGMAGNAGIRYVGAKNCFNSALFAADQYAVDNHIASAISNSWGDPSGDLLDDSATQNAYNNLFLLAGSTGISMLYSSGDDGDNFDLTGLSAPGFPDSSPFATSVGGTTTKINANGQRTGDLGWATGRAYKCTPNAVKLGAPGCTKSNLGKWGPALEDGMSGGYTSYRYLQPYYQRGVVPKALSERNAPIFGSQPLRVTPDISLDADPGTGFLIGITQKFPNTGAHYSQTRYGGTSLASPLLAGLVADINQTSRQNLGFLNPTLYRIDRTKPSAIYDVLRAGKQGNFRRDYANQVNPSDGFLVQFRELYFGGPEVYCDAAGNCAQRPNTLSAFKGYDSLTGMGSPGKGFIAAVAGK
jgi:subtilase family serine protease